MRLAWSGTVAEGAILPKAMYVHATKFLAVGKYNPETTFSLRRLLLPIPIPYRTEVLTLCADAWNVGWHFPCVTFVRVNLDPPSLHFSMIPWKTKLVSTSWEAQQYGS